MEQMRPGRNGGKLKVGGSHPRAGRPKNILNKIEEAIGKQFTVSFSKVDKLRIMESMLEMSMADAYVYAAEVMACNMMAEDAQEGIDAFIAKRQPVWKGR